MLLFSKHLHRPAVAAVFLMFSVLCPSSSADEVKGFYAGGAVGLGNAYVDYKKSVGIDIPPASSRQAADDKQGGISALKVLLGHRWNLSDSTYLSSEVEASRGLDSRVTGFLGGTGIGDRDVWPGEWYLEKEQSVGFNVKLGYAPEKIDFWGDGGSVYTISGIQRLNLAIEVTACNGTIAGAGGDNCQGTVSGKIHRDLHKFPWFIGAGMEFGSDKSRLDIRISYTAYDDSFGGGDGKLHFTETELWIQDQGMGHPSGL